MKKIKVYSAYLFCLLVLFCHTPSLAQVEEHGDILLKGNTYYKGISWQNIQHRFYSYGGNSLDAKWLVHTMPSNGGRFVIVAGPEGVNGSSHPAFSVESNKNSLFYGNIGMGTTSPGAQLDIQKTSSFNLPLLNLNYPWDKADLFQIKRGSSPMVKIGNGGGTYSHGVVDLYSSNESKVKLSGSPLVPTYFNAGNVGIGTTAPQATLDVRGNLLIERNGSPTVFTGTGTEELNRYLKLINSPGRTSASGLMAGGILVADSYAFATPGKNDLIVKGQVGIGTNSPGSYQLAVEGKIGAHEIKVTTSGWADFVFMDDYVLRPLAEVEQHIWQKGHLPDVPSEAEVLENGIELGAMDVKLLQKIEELTLYAIAQKKTSEEQARRIREQAEEMERLKQENQALQKLTEKLLELEEKVHQLQAAK